MLELDVRLTADKQVQTNHIEASRSYSMIVQVRVVLRRTFVGDQLQRTSFITSLTDNNFSLDSEDDFRSGCRNVSHQQQFFSELLSRGQLHYMTH